MANTIRIKRGSVSGTKPASLDSGELAINLVGGGLFYGDSSGNTQLLIAPTIVSPYTETQVDPRNGQVLFDPVTKNLYVYNEDSLKWEVVGFPQAGGVVGDTFTVFYDGTTFIRTSLDLNSGEGSERPGTMIGPNANIPGSLLVQSIVTSLSVLIGENLLVQGNAAVSGLLTVTELINGQEGAYTFWTDPSLTSGRCRIGSHAGGPPANSTGANGDIWYGV